MRWLALGLLSLALLAGCSAPFPPTYQSVPISPTPKVEVTIIRTPTPVSEITLPASTPDPKCLPPCFYGIIPGKATLTETASLLGVTSPSEEALVWWTKVPQRPLYASGRDLPDHIWFRNGLVSSIVIYEQQDVTLQEIVNKYGGPEAITIGNPDIYNLTDFILIYASKGVAFMGTYQPGDIPYNQYTPTPDIFVDSEIYFLPMPVAGLTPEIVVRWRMGDSVEGIYPWRGFGHPVAGGR